MENLVYLVVGLLIGVAFGVTVGWALWRKIPAIRPNLVSDQVVCGACRSPILGPPLKVVLTDHDAFKVFRCNQCGTVVTSPLPK